MKESGQQEWEGEKKRKLKTHTHTHTHPTNVLVEHVLTQNKILDLINRIPTHAFYVLDWKIQQ